MNSLNEKAFEFGGTSSGTGKLGANMSKLLRDKLHLFALALVTPGALLGCVAEGPLYSEYAHQRYPVATDKTRIVLLRPRDRYDDYRASSAKIRVNGETVGKLQYGGFLSVDVAAGDVVVWVSTNNPLGNPLINSCEHRLKTAPASSVFIDVSPRTGSVVAGVLGGVVGGAATPSAATFGIDEVGKAVVVVSAQKEAGRAVGSVVAETLESNGKTCGGPFELRVVAEEAALELAEELRLSP